MEINNAVNPELKKYVQAYISSNFDRIVEDLRTLVKVPSYRTDDPSPCCPFGPGPAAGVEAAAKLYESYGYAVERYPEDGYALVRAGSGEKTLGFFCHCDTVPGDTGVWNYAETPYDVTYHGDFLIGRGVKDNKGAAIAVLHSLLALREAGAEPEHSILVFLGSNEETGMKDAEAFRARHRLPDVSLVPDCDPPLCRGERSYCCFDLTSEGGFETILNFAGGTAWAVVGDATVTLPASAQLKAEITAALEGRTDAVLSENADGTLSLVATGATAHPGMPKKSINAAWIASEILLQCPALGENDLALLAQIRDMTREPFGNYFGVTFHDEDFGDLYLSCCEISIADGHINLLFRCNYNTAFPVETIQARASAKAAETGWVYRFTDDDKGFVKGIDHPVVNLVLDIYHTLCAENGVTKTFRIYTSPSGTYARRLENAYAIGIDVPYTKVPADFPLGHGRVHEADECLGIPNYKEGILQMAMMMNVLDRELENLPSAND